MYLIIIGNKLFNIFIYLLDIHLILLPWGRHTTMPRKEIRRKELRKNGLGKKVKPSTPTQATDARMGKEEKNRKQKEEQKKETGRWAPNPPT